jgi:hypothetical protein
MSQDLKWFKSSRSQPQTNDCVEVAGDVDGCVHVRDTKDRTGPTLTFGPSEWAAFVGGVKDGEFDMT